jgi:diguanylate cyclase (GGDEF)-like protein/PAS domain S-box-containing protein
MDATSRVREVLRADEDAPRAARVMVDKALANEADELRERVRLAASELVTNSICHADGPDVTVEVAVDADGAVELRVEDQGEGFKFVPRIGRDPSISGWGLGLVAMLSESWQAGGLGKPWVAAHFEPRAEFPAEPVAKSSDIEGRIRELLDVRMVLDSIKDYGVIAVDRDGRISLWNSGAEQLTGFAPADVLGEPLSILVADRTEPLTDDDLATALAHGHNEHQYWVRRKDGSRFWADCVVTPIYDSAGRLRGYTDVMRDMTWRKRIDDDREGMIRRIRELARTDDLTGLPNRRQWREELDRELARARRRGQTMCVAMIDVDGLKAVNDTLGHLAGDEVLRSTAEAWSESLRATDMLARYGGDEFSAILPDCSLDQALTVIERLRAATPAPTTCSAGIAGSEAREPADALIGRADAALYEAKRRGRNAVAVAG